MQGCALLFGGGGDGADNGVILDVDSEFIAGDYVEIEGSSSL